MIFITKTRKDENTKNRYFIVIVIIMFQIAVHSIQNIFIKAGINFVLSKFRVFVI